MTTDKLAAAIVGAAMEMKKQGKDFDEFLGYLRMVANFPFVKSFVVDWLNEELGDSPQTRACVDFILGYTN